MLLQALELISIVKLYKKFNLTFPLMVHIIFVEGVKLKDARPDNNWDSLLNPSSQLTNKSYYV